MEAVFMMMSKKQDKIEIPASRARLRLRQNNAPVARNNIISTSFF
jgi:hypothetical protein